MMWQGHGVVFDAERHLLVRNGQPVRLSPKAWTLLETLIAQRPQAQAKADLHDRLWPNTFVVEANLSNLIGEVRRALGDDPRQPRFIRTVQRYGYAFCADPTDAAPTPDGASMCRIVWAGGGVWLPDGRHIVGRDASAAVFLDSPGVSRRHARIEIAGREATFEDLDSKNGSFLHGARITQPIRLADGDVVTVGVVALTFRVVQPQTPTESVER